MASAACEGWAPESSSEDHPGGRFAKAATAGGSGKVKKTRKVSHFRKAVAPLHDVTEEDIGFTSHVYGQPEQASPRSDHIDIAPMSTFTQTFPETRLDSECALTAAKVAAATTQLMPRLGKSATAAAAAMDGKPNSAELSVHKKDLSDVELRQIHYDQSQAPLAEIERLRQYESLMLQTQYVMSNGASMSHDNASLMLRTNHISLPLVDADTESETMRESGTFFFYQASAPQNSAWRTFPACSMGNRCVGMDGRRNPHTGEWESDIAGLQKPVILTKCMTKVQWDALISIGQVPANNGWPCVLCHRRNTEQFVNQFRFGSPDAKQRILFDTSYVPVYQLWRNGKDTPGGYHRAHMIRVREHEVVVAPLARFSSRMLRAHWVPLTQPPGGAPLGMWKVSQEHLIFREDAIPAVQIGENDLLRTGICSIDSVGMRVDIGRVHALLADPLTDRNVQHVASQVADAYRLSGQYTGILPLEADPQWTGCINSFTLPMFTCEVGNMSYTSDIAKLKDPVTILFSKCIPARGQTRTTHARAEKLLFPPQSLIDKYDKVQSERVAVRINVMAASITDEMQRVAQSQDAIGVEYAKTGTRRSKRDRAANRIRDAYIAFSERRAHFRRIMVGGVLGNYPHVDSNRLHGPTRQWVRDRLETSDQWLQAILHGCPLLFIWCVREFLVDHLQDAAGLRGAVAGYMRFAHFTRITKKAMAAARLYIQQNACHAWSNLGQYEPPAELFTCKCLAEKKNVRKGTARPPSVKCVYENVEWLRDLTAILHPFHDELLEVAFRKPDTSILSFLMGEHVRLKSPLVPRRFTPREQEEMDLEQTRIRQLTIEEEEEDQMRDIAHQMEVAVLAARKKRRRVDEEQHPEDVPPEQRIRTSKADEMGIKNFFAVQSKQAIQEREARRKAQEIDGRTAANVYQYIAPHQFEELARLTRVCPSLAAVVPFLPCFGVDDPRVVEFIQELLSHCENGTVTKSERFRQVHLLRVREPHAYNLLQVAAELIRHRGSNRPTIVGVLSAEERQAQIEALRRRSREILVSDLQQMLDQTEKNITKVRSKMKRNKDEWLPSVCANLEIRNFFTQRIASIDAAYWKHPLIEQTSTTLQYCAVCSAVYSNYRALTRSKRRFSRWGLQNAWVSQYPKRLIHCGNNKINHVGECAKVPLETVSLIGARVLLDKTPFQLCVECGDVMVPSARHCIDLGKGMLCVGCSNMHKKMQLREMDPAVKWAQTLERHCPCCGYKTVTPTNTVMLPHGVVLCRKCAYRTRGLLATVKAHNLAGSLASYDQTRSLAVQVFESRRLHVHKALAAKHRPQIKAQRMKARMKRR